MITMDNKVSEINGRNKLSNLVWEFNFRPDHYVHDSWLEKMPEGPLIKKLVGRHRRADKIVQYLLERFGLENQVFFSFSNSLTKIALWSGKDLEKLVMLAGAVFFHERVKKVITHDELHELRSKVGDEIFQFMQNRAMPIKGKIEFDLVLPAKMDVNDAIVLSGLLCLHSALSGYSMSLRKRLMLKLPYEWYVLFKRSAVLGRELNKQNAECAALIQKLAIEIKIGVGSDGQIHFN